MPDLLEYVEEPGEPGHVEPERVPVGVVVLPQLRLTLQYRQVCFKGAVSRDFLPFFIS